MQRFSSIILVDPRGWILLQERDEHPRIDPECWGFVGGHLDGDETPLSGAYRELAEETGLVWEAGLEHWHTYAIFHQAYGTDDEVNIFVGTLPESTAVSTGEGRQIVCVDPESLPAPLTVAARQILPEFLQSSTYQELATWPSN